MYVHDAFRAVSQLMSFPRIVTFQSRFSVIGFARCAESNLLGLVDTQTAVIEAELLAGKVRMC